MISVFAFWYLGGGCSFVSLSNKGDAPNWDSAYASVISVSNWSHFPYVTYHLGIFASGEAS